MFGQGAQQQQQQQQQQRWLQQGAQYADEFAAMEEAYREGVQRPPTPFPHQMLLNGDRGALQPFLQVRATCNTIPPSYQSLRQSPTLHHATTHDHRPTPSKAEYAVTQNTSQLPSGPQPGNRALPTQAFVESGRLGSDFRPMPAAGVALTVADQCRVRDRSTIMARHLYADLGDEFADTQV